MKNHLKCVLGTRMGAQVMVSALELNVNFKRSRFLLMIACNSTGSKKIATHSSECRIISIFDDSSPFHPDDGSFEVNLFLIHTKLRLLQQNYSIRMYFIFMLKTVYVVQLNAREVNPHFEYQIKPPVNVTALN